MNDVETYLYGRINAILEQMNPLAAQLIEAAAALRALDEHPKRQKWIDTKDGPAIVPMARPLRFKSKITTADKVRELLEKSGRAGITAGEAKAKLGKPVGQWLNYMTKKGDVTLKNRRYVTNGHG